jgi:hypothetical protein
VGIYVRVWMVPGGRVQILQSESKMECGARVVGEQCTNERVWGLNRGPRGGDFLNGYIM